MDYQELTERIRKQTAKIIKRTEHVKKEQKAKVSALESEVSKLRRKYD